MLDLVAVAKQRWHAEPVDPKAPHFVWREFFDWHVAKPPPLAARPAIHHLAIAVLEPLRRHYGPVRLLSAYRTQATNLAVGGAKRSHHLYDLWPSSPAVDLVAEDGSVDDWARFLEALRVGGLGTYATHVHVDLRKARARWTG